ncbi:J-domain-containing protein [Nocardioides sp. AX2bis]|uniref:DnaJ family domain-containing protein n=1 Tax=Nocardioides sp. AX2bis TaxID=2653157 RepID=UPI0012F1A11B|nr:DUF1992 domain-containing protein [Nocardioides sp. AX2bis]VXC28054.1 conserved hypothetical protein [Nocardioides sp. AX2bis]
MSQAPDDFDLGDRLARAEGDEQRGRHSSHKDARTGRSAAAMRIQQQQTWVEEQLRIAMERGDFDDLPGAGRPIRDLGQSHDPDWWLKRLVERENITVLPASLQLRKDDAALDERLDALAVEREVRREVEEFNARVIRARYTPADGTPPLITMPRDVEETLAGWRGRRAARTAELAARRAAEDAARPPRRRWWQRRAR